MPASPVLPSIAALNLPGFSLLPVPANDALLLRMSGNGDMAAIEPLSCYLKEVHQEALRLAVPEVHLDLDELYFLNSSCLKSLLAWVHQLASHNRPAYRVCFLTSPRLHWQRRSLEALRRLAPEVVSVV